MSTEIYRGQTGRGFAPYDLLDEMQDTYGLDRTSTHEAIIAFLDQVADLDGTDATIEDDRPAKPELLVRNHNDRDVDHWITISDTAADSIREAFAASYPAKA